MLKGSHLAVMGPLACGEGTSCDVSTGVGTREFEAGHKEEADRQTAPGPLGTSSRPPGPRHPRPFSLNQYYLHYLSVGPTAGDLERHHGSRSSCGQEAKPKGGTRGPNHSFALGCYGSLAWSGDTRLPLSKGKPEMIGLQRAAAVLMEEMTKVLCVQGGFKSHFSIKKDQDPVKTLPRRRT